MFMKWEMHYTQGLLYGNTFDDTDTQNVLDNVAAESAPNVKVSSSDLIYSLGYS